MDKNYICNILENARRKITKINDSLETNDIDVEVYLVRKRTNGHYYFKTVPITDAVQLKLAASLIGTNIGIIASNNISPYNAVGADADTVEYMACDQVAAWATLQDDLNSAENVSCITTSIDQKFNISKADFYLIKIKGFDEDLIFLKRYSNTKRLNQFIPLRWFDTTYSILEEDLLLIDPLADLIIFGDNLLILNRYALEVVLSYKDRFFAILESSLDKLKEHDIIENFQEFRLDCSNDIKIARIFTQIYKKDNLDKVLANLNNIPSTIEALGLTIEFKDNKLIYKSPNDLQCIVTILSDSLAKTFIGGRNVTAKL